MAYKERLQQNNTDLNGILADLNQLPNMPTPNPPAVYQNLKVTENGTYTAGTGYDAIGQVEVEVAGNKLNTFTVTIVNASTSPLVCTNYTSIENNEITPCLIQNLAVGSSTSCICLCGSIMAVTLESLSSVEGFASGSMDLIPFNNYASCIFTYKIPTDAGSHTVTFE